MALHLPTARLLWIVAAALAPSISLAQPADPVPAPQPVTFRSERIPVGYTGPSVDDLLTNIAARGSSSKGRFETSAEFVARRSRELSAPLSDGLPVSAERVFVLRNPVSLTYNADRRQATWPDRPLDFTSLMQGGCRPSSAVTNAIESVSRENRGIYIICDIQSRESHSTYMARTRLNVPFEVHRREAHSHSITLCSIGDRGRDGCFPFMATRHLTMQPERAMQLLRTDGGTLRMAIAGRPIEPFVLQATDTSGVPSLDNPIETSQETTSLRLQVTGILMFDVETGEIILRLPAASTNQTPQSSRRR